MVVPKRESPRKIAVRDHVRVIHVLAPHFLRKHSYWPYMYPLYPQRDLSWEYATDDLYVFRDLLHEKRQI